MFTKLIILTISPLLCWCWSGILIDSQTGTQVFNPQSAPHTVGNLDFGLPHNNWAVAVPLNGLVYFIGGYPDFNDVWIFNPKTNATTQGPQLNTGRFDHAATAVGNSIITCGGSDQNTNAIASCEQLTPSAGNKWVIIASLPEARQLPDMVTIANRAYIFGGVKSDSCADQPSNAVYMYDGKSWNTRAAMPTATMGLESIALDNNRALVCGGRIDCGTALATCNIYSAQTNTWTSAASMAQARNWFVMAMFNGRVYIMGGENTPGSIELYSPSTGGQVLPYQLALPDYALAAAAINSNTVDDNLDVGVDASKVGRLNLSAKKIMNAKHM